MTPYPLRLTFKWNITSAGGFAVLVCGGDVVWSVEHVFASGHTLLIRPSIYISSAQWTLEPVKVRLKSWHGSMRNLFCLSFLVHCMPKRSLFCPSFLLKNADEIFFSVPEDQVSDQSKDTIKVTLIRKFMLWQLVLSGCHWPYWTSMQGEKYEILYHSGNSIPLLRANHHKPSVQLHFVQSSS